MTTNPAASLRNIASECVALVASQFGRQLDWSMDSLRELDTVCDDLLADGPLNNQRGELWWKLIGAYTGQVLIDTYGGEWTEHEMAAGAYAVVVQGTTAFPFGIARRVLRGEPGKSLASFGRALPAVIARSEQPD
jgi:hypothetical protein